MKEELKTKLDTLVKEYNTPAFIENDPVRFVRIFTDKRDIEVAAFLVSMIAWGRREQINSSCKKLLADIMECKPYEYVMSEKWRELNPDMNIHRTFWGRDLQYMCRGLHYLYGNSLETLENIFSGALDMWDCMDDFFTFMQYPSDYGNRHLPNPERAACKRMHLMLRWLVRNDGIVDLGIWKNVNPADLYIPLDVHVAEAARELGLLTRKQNDRKAVEELTARLRELDPEDPVKYDFALFGYSLNKKV